MQSSARPPLAPRPLPAAPRSQPHQQQAQQQGRGAATEAAQGGGGSFLSYTVQKLNGNGRANHAAFWLQTEGGDSELAVVVSGDAAQPAAGQAGLAGCLGFEERRQEWCALFSWGLV